MINTEAFHAAWSQLRVALQDVERAAAAVDAALGVAPQAQLQRTSKLQLIEHILREKPGIGIDEIVDQLRRRGYQFYGKRPVASTRSLMYSQKMLFRSDRGRFYLVNPAAEEKAR